MRMKVEWVRDCDLVREDLAEPQSRIGWKGWKGELEIPSSIGSHRHIAARRAHHKDAAAPQRPTYMKDLECLAERGEGLAARNAGLAAKGIEHIVRASQ